MSTYVADDGVMWWNLG